MNHDDNNFPSGLKLQARYEHIQTIVSRQKVEVKEPVAACERAIQEAIERLSQKKQAVQTINEKIAALRQQSASAETKVRIVRDKAQADFDLAMKGDVEATQIAASKELSKAELAMQAFSQVSPEVLRIRALEQQAATAATAVHPVEVEIERAKNALVEALYQVACVEYDEAIGVALKGAIHLHKANQARKKPAFINDFYQSSFWISSGHRAISHLQFPSGEPVTINAFYFKSLIDQGFDTDF